MPFFIPLLLFAGSLIADYLIQQKFDEDARQREQEYLSSYGARDVVQAKRFGRYEIEEPEYDEGDGDFGAAYLRQSLFG